MIRPPGLEAAPAEAVITLCTCHTAGGQWKSLSPDSNLQTVPSSAPLHHSQGVCHPVTSTVANKTVYSLQAPFIFLYLSLAVWAVLWNELSQMFALGFTCHSLIVSIIIHPPRHVAAAGRIMGLRERETVKHTEAEGCVPNLKQHSPWSSLASPLGSCSWSRISRSTWNRLLHNQVPP